MRIHEYTLIVTNVFEFDENTEVSYEDDCGVGSRCSYGYVSVIVKKKVLCIVKR